MSEKDKVHIHNSHRSDIFIWIKWDDLKSIFYLSTGMRGVQPSFGRSPGPQMPMVTRGGRPQGRSLYRPGSSTGTRRQDAGYHQMKGKERGPMPGMGKPHPDMWVGKARGRSLRLEDNYMGNNDQRGELSLGRGWNRP